MSLSQCAMREKGNITIPPNTFFEVQKEHSVHKKEYADTQMLFILQRPIKNRALTEYPAGRSTPECQNGLLYL